MSRPASFSFSASTPTPTLLAVALRSGEVRYVEMSAWQSADHELQSISGASGKPAGAIGRQQVAELIGPVQVKLPSWGERDMRRSA